MTFTPFPQIRVSGEPADRGLQYGVQAHAQIHAGREGYERNFHRSGIRWAKAVGYARRYADSIADAFPQLISELEGIAAGSGLEFDDVLAMNCRTEIMWSRVNEQLPSTRVPAECSSFGLTPDRTEAAHAWIGQNWDWLVHAFDSVILLEVERPDGPNYVTVVEAGLLAKSTLNAAGIGIAVNTLITSDDADTDGIPFHVLLRALADAETVFDAVELLASHRRASSGHYLVGGADGAVLSIECEPGGVAGVHPISPNGGLVVHTNHFVSRTRGDDLAPLVMADSYVRMQRLRDRLDESKLASIASIHRALGDHTDHPGSICCHPDPRSDETARWASISSMIMDLPERALFLCEGNPCEVPRRRIDFGPLLQPEAAHVEAVG